TAPMRLESHPASPPGPVQHIEVRARRAVDDRLNITWQLAADLARVRIPEPMPAARADGLWRHTCFELFVADPAGSAYREFNFSPAGAWAAYLFSGYRTGMAPLPLADPPACRWQRSPAELRLTVELSLADLLPGWRQASPRLALAAVIEDDSGALGYWALRHRAGPPDFHASEGFVLDPASSDAA
ncbi:MAG: DOMON-like domain-containing protein, partial [Gammaproteobacteria bacterium]